MEAPDIIKTNHELTPIESSPFTIAEHIKSDSAITEQATDAKESAEDAVPSTDALNIEAIQIHIGEQPEPAVVVEAVGSSCCPDEVAKPAAEGTDAVEAVSAFEGTQDSVDASTESQVDVKLSNQDKLASAHQLHWDTLQPEEHVVKRQVGSTVSLPSDV